MRILLLGSGGREHTFAWKLAQSPLLTKLFIAPGNAGTMLHGENVDIAPCDFESIKQFVKNNQIDLMLVGPEEPLVRGIHDYFLSNDELKNIPVIGPCMDGAMLEGSKDFAKAFMIRNNIPTAAYQTFTKETILQAFDFIDTLQAPYVLKADGLAAGKGVLILNTAEEAKDELSRMLINNKFGVASNKVVIEEFLKGIELSVFVVTDGISYKILPEAKDYKRIGEGDTGPNTGGMGTVSGVGFATNDFMKKVEDRIIKPTISGLIEGKINYKGFIFIGLMNVDGNPYVIEYNVRMGDPETESVLPRLENDFVELLSAIGNKSLQNISIVIDKRVTATVMLVSKGYPDAYEKGKIISGLNNSDGSIIFHAGTIITNDGSIVTNGGRVFGVTSYGENLQQALDASYRNISTIQFEGKSFRTDIGQDVLNLK
ncbi:MAG: phosphoribosylamine--glycine ligase [Bacteroidota bacterium]